MKELIGVAIFCIIFVMAIVYFSPKTCLIQRSGIETFTDVPTVDSCPAGTYSYVTRTGNTQCCSVQPNGSSCDGEVVCTMNGEGNTTLPKCRRKLVLINKEVNLLRDSVIKRSVNMPHDYTFQFVVHILDVVKDWSALFRFTGTNNNCCNFGDRVLAGWLYGGQTRLHLRIGDRQNGNWGIDTPSDLPKNRDVHIKVVAKGKNVKLYVDGKLVNEGNMPSGENSRYTGNVTFGVPETKLGMHPRPIAYINHVTLE